MPSFKTVFVQTEARLAAAEVHCGHGYVDAHDEAIALVLAAAGLSLHTGREILETAFPPEAIERLHGFVSQRIDERRPVAYIIGEAWLGPYAFRADSRALVPRSPIAEVILDAFAPWWCADHSPRRIVDVCCGGGSLGLIAALEYPDASVYLMDIDPEALSLAAENRRLHGVEESVTLLCADLLAPLGDGTVDVILANPPYVDAGDMAALPLEYLHEPGHALAAGEDGLQWVPSLLQQGERVLTPEGLLFLEVGNSWPALEAAYPTFGFLWLALANGGHGVTVLNKDELQRLIEQPPPRMGDD